nr:hypothetical protein [Tanacetum cinerariifolium]
EKIHQLDLKKKSECACTYEKKSKIKIFLGPIGQEFTVALYITYKEAEELGTPNRVTADSEARSWSIPSEDLYEEAAQQLFEQAPHSPVYVPRDHVPVFVPKFEHPEDLVPAEDKAPASLLPPGFLSPRIRPLSPRALEDYMNSIASSLYHSLHPSGTPPLLPITLLVPSTSRRAKIPEADTPPRKRLLLTAPKPGYEAGESSAAAAARQPGPTMACSEDRAAVRAEIEVLRRERLAYEQEMLETPARRHEWQRQTADDFAVQHIMRTQALEAGARIDTLEDTGTEGAVGLTRWIEKMESVFNISGDNNIPAYTNRFQELALICTKFVSNETEKVDKYISGLPDNNYRNVKSLKPKTLEETIELANDLMDQKLCTYAERKSDSKRKADDISRNNQQPFKKQNVAKAYNLGFAEKKTYEGNVPKCTKCQRNHPGPCTLKCHKYGKIGHYAGDCRSTGNTNATNNR